MKILAQNLGFATFLALGSLAAGCASSPSTPAGDEGGDGGSDGGGGGEGGSGGDGGGGGSTGATLDASGTYALTSTYDVSTNIPGTVGTIINDFIDATSGPNEPTQWVLQQLVNQLPSGTVQTIANDALPFVSGYLNDQLLNWAPSFVTDIITVGNDFGDMAKKFGINETYVVTKGSNGSYTAVDTATGVHFTIGTVQEDFNFTDYNSTNVVVNAVPRPALRQDPQHRPRRRDPAARRPERDQPPDVLHRRDRLQLGRRVRRAGDRERPRHRPRLERVRDGLHRRPQRGREPRLLAAQQPERDGAHVRPLERHRQGRRHQRRRLDRPDQRR
jgi:hypothetical protein